MELVGDVCEYSELACIRQRKVREEGYYEPTTGSKRIYAPQF